MNYRRFFLDLAERAATTYVEALLGFVLLAPVLDVSILTAALVAGLPALFSVLKAGVYEFLEVRPRRSFAMDLLERTVGTYVVTFLGLVIVNPGEIATYKVAIVSALPAALAVVKGALASRVASPTNASLVELPTPPPTPRP